MATKCRVSSDDSLHGKMKHEGDRRALASYTQTRDFRNDM